ncbi:MAG: hypothetical protein AB8F26_02520 [Phycisphaerales bacterium]
MVINDRFHYSESLSQSANNVTADDRDAFPVDLQPGDVLDFRLSQATASATAVGSNGSPSGSAFAELDVEINIDVIAGEAQTAAASSGGDYTTQPCIADLAEPLGTLNFFDVAAYIAAYSSGCP